MYYSMAGLLIGELLQPTLQIHLRGTIRNMGHTAWAHYICRAPIGVYGPPLYTVFFVEMLWGYEGVHDGRHKAD